MSSGLVRGGGRGCIGLGERGGGYAKAGVRDVRLRAMLRYRVISSV